MEDNNNLVENLFSKLQGHSLGMSLSKFVELNLSILNELKELKVPLKVQSEFIENFIKKKVSPASLSVAMSRLNSSSGQNTNIIIMEKKIPSRFVPKDAKLTLGGQFEKQQIIRNGVVVGLKDVQIDWRGLYPNESISNWIIEHKDKLIGVNNLGWRWEQIAEAISEHLSLSNPISKNTLTSVISISNKKNHLKK